MTRQSGGTSYIDTGVLGAYYCPELLSAAAEDALRRSDWLRRTAMAASDFPPVSESSLRQRLVTRPRSGPTTHLSWWRWRKAPVGPSPFPYD